MRGLVAALPLFLLGCQPPVTAAPRAVVELYMHPNGLSNCVEESNGKWKADASCCPTGFEVAGFSVPAATSYEAANEKETRRLYRHLVCIEVPPAPPGPPK
ncbi:MAG: hypothetical protein R3F61_37770 [Myxococcota bacterium]